MTSGFYRNSESVCGLCQKNALGLSSMLFFSTAYFLFYLLHNCSSVTPCLSPRITDKLEDLPLLPHFPKQLPAPGPLMKSQFFVTSWPHFILIPPKTSLLHICIPHSHSLFVLCSLTRHLIFHYFFSPDTVSEAL